MKRLTSDTPPAIVKAMLDDLVLRLQTFEVLKGHPPVGLMGAPPYTITLPNGLVLARKGWVNSNQRPVSRFWSYMDTPRRSVELIIEYHDSEDAWFINKASVLCGGDKLWTVFYAQDSFPMAVFVGRLLGLDDLPDVRYLRHNISFERLKEVMPIGGGALFGVDTDLTRRFQAQGDFIVTTCDAALIETIDETIAPHAGNFTWFYRP